MFLAYIFYWIMRGYTASLKYEKKCEDLRADLINLDSETWDTYYFNVTGHHPNSTITLSRRTP